MPVDLSILIPAYNRPEHLDELLASILDQNSSSCEIIVSDDCSPESIQIKAVLENWKSRFDNVHFFMQEKNLGEVGNKNFLYEKAIGRYVLYIGDDDLLIEGALASLLGLANRYQKHDVVILGYKLEDDFARAGKSYRSIIPFSISGRSLTSYGAANFDWFPFHFGHPASYMFRNRNEVCTLFQKDVGFAEDLAHLAISLLRDDSFHFTNKYYIKWRKDWTRPQTNQSSDNELHIESRILLKKYMRTISKSAAVKNLDIRDRRFLYCQRRESGDIFFTRLINILEIVSNYIQIFWNTLVLGIKERLSKTPNPNHGKKLD